MAARTESRLTTTDLENVGDGDMQAANRLNLTLLTHKWVELSIGSLRFTAPYAAKIQKPIYQLPKEAKSRVIITSEMDLR